MLMKLVDAVPNPDPEAITSSTDVQTDEIEPADNGTNK